MTSRNSSQRLEGMETCTLALIRVTSTVYNTKYIHCHSNVHYQLQGTRQYQVINAYKLIIREKNTKTLIAPVLWNDLSCIILQLTPENHFIATLQFNVQLWVWFDYIYQMSKKKKKKDRKKKRKQKEKTFNVWPLGRHELMLHIMPRQSQLVLVESFLQAQFSYTAVFYHHRHYQRQHTFKVKVCNQSDN